MRYAELFCSPLSSVTSKTASCESEHAPWSRYKVLVKIDFLFPNFQLVATEIANNIREVIDVVVLNRVAPAGISQQCSAGETRDWTSANFSRAPLRRASRAARRVDDKYNNIVRRLENSRIVKHIT